MRVCWSLVCRGRDPINARRKVTHVLRVAGVEGRVAPWIDRSRHVEFFSELQADTWEAAIAEVLAVATRFSTHWELSLLNEAICGATRERKVECVEVLNFELRRDQLPGAPSP